MKTCICPARFSGVDEEAYKAAGCPSCTCKHPVFVRGCLHKRGFDVWNCPETDSHYGITLELIDWQAYLEVKLVLKQLLQAYEDACENDDGAVYKQWRADVEQKAKELLDE